MSLNLVYSRVEKQLAGLGFDTSGLAEKIASQDPAIFIQILHFVMVDCCPAFYATLVEDKYSLFKLKDSRFLNTLYTILVCSSDKEVRREARADDRAVLIRRVRRAQARALRKMHCARRGFPAEKQS